MDIGKILTELRAELETLDSAILSLERLQNMAPRRGRPAGKRREAVNSVQLPDAPARPGTARKTR